jgi:hypothetical protein
MVFLDIRQQYHSMFWHFFLNDASIPILMGNGDMCLKKTSLPCSSPREKIILLHLALLFSKCGMINNSNPVCLSYFVVYS